jgi:hypothetical protein
MKNMNNFDKNFERCCPFFFFFMWGTKNLMNEVICK